MRIALVHYSSAPVIAGVELVMAAHASLFRAAGHEVTFVIEPGTADPPTEAAIRELQERLRPVFARQAVVMLHNVATMHFHLALTAAVWRLADELPHVRFVCWVHDLAACNPDYAPLPLERAPWDLLAKAHPRFTYVAVSEWRRRQFLELINQPDTRCRTIPNGVHPLHLLDLPPHLAALAEKHALLERELVLLQPARLLRRKNVELTLHVTAALKAAGHSCAALITAPPEIHHSASANHEAELRALHAQLALDDDAFFLSDDEPLGPSDLAALHRLADALFFPSRQEGFGLPVLEAAVHRLPIFCSAVEPLTSLLPAARVTALPLDSSPAQIATLIVETLAADRAHVARKETQRTFSWPAIDRNFLSPLLIETETY